MSQRIRQLPPDISNKIAAGEVVERPSNAVKELVENALDAGARRITITIEDGGKKLIRVRDDGCGMSAQDAVLSLQRHATSKIQQADDLWRIQTLGFRGEAMSSLAAVSRLEITTREESAEVGTRVVVEAGEILGVEEVGCAPGTEIVVRGLFFNTPARFKFLKSDSVEAARIAEMVGHMALAYPHVAFVLKHNGSESQRVEAGGDSFNALVSVWGRDTAKAMLPINTSREHPGVKVTGFAGRPQFTRANRSRQLFFVNGRPVTDKTLQHAFEAAYEGLIHGRDRYPQGLLFIQVDAGEVDVNVHPTKSEIRFVDKNAAHHALRVAVRGTLVAAQLAPSLELSEETPETRTTPAKDTAQSPLPSGSRSPAPFAPLSPIEAPQSSRFQGTTPEPRPAPSSDLSRPFVPAPVQNAGADDRFRQHLLAMRDGQTSDHVARERDVSGVPSSSPVPTGMASGGTTSNGTISTASDRTSGLPRDIHQHQQEQRPEEDGFDQELLPDAAPAKLKLRSLGQVTQNTYIACEGEDGLYLVNQHRAHERILADRAIERASREKVESQLLMIPLAVECGPRALAAVEENGTLLGELGFEVESFGGDAVLVRAVPMLVAQGDYERAFADLLDELISGHGGSNLEERRRTLLTLLSCKNAIKAGDPLNLAQMQGLVDDLVELPNPSICPHGQPILIKIPNVDLHKKLGGEYTLR